MISAFDPRAFIEAEEREHSHAFAMPASDGEQILAVANPQKTAILPKPHDLHSQHPPHSPPLATFSSIWCHAAARMETLERPAGIKVDRWNDLLRLVKWTAEDWSAAAVELRWHPLEFFGCNPDPYAGRGDRDGVVTSMFRMPTPTKITAVLADCVEITDRGGSVMRYRPFGPRGQVYLWEAYAMKEGP